MDHEYFMEKAIELSLENIRNGLGGPFGAIIVKDGKIIGSGANHVTSDKDPTAHAEMVAIRDACKNLDSFQLNDCCIYTSCEPCPMCLGAIYRARIKQIYYANDKHDAAQIGFDDHFIYQELGKNTRDRDIPLLQLKRNDAIKIFEERTQKDDKITY